MDSAHEGLIRLICFASVFLTMSLWELIAPWRRLSVRKPVRWFNNLVLVALNSVSARLITPLSAVGMAALAGERRFGLFQWVDAPVFAEFAVSLAVLDLALYVQHVVFHAVPMLWRLHRVHHVDLDFDVTTGLRFHTLEILLSMAWKVSVVGAIGASPWAVLVFEVLLNASSMITHGNVHLPEWFDRMLRWISVTPDMHRVHHSADPEETNSNYGFNLSWWDRVFGTYRTRTRVDDAVMDIGVREFRDENQTQRLPAMLFLPFRRSESLHS